MGLKSISYMCVLIYIAIASYLYESANGATYTDHMITDYVSARLYVPNAYPYNDYGDKKLPLVVYYHGGGFALGSTSDLLYNNFVGEIVDQSNVIIISVDYRLLDVSTAYDDSWSSLHYVASHHSGSGTNPTLNTKVDFKRIFLSGDSAGGNIAHNMAMEIASNEIRGLRIKGIALLCPFFWGLEPLLGEPIDPFWRLIENGIWVAFGKSLDLDDTRINPLLDPNLARIGTSNVFVITAYEDPLYYRGHAYASLLQSNGYNGKVEYYEYTGEHDFFLESWAAAYNVHPRLSSFFNSI